MVHKNVSGLKFLRSYKSFPVYYVESKDLVEVSGVELYKKGFGVKEENWNDEAYSDYFLKNDYAGSIDKFCDVKPNFFDIVPGIEIRAGGNLWKSENGELAFYTMVDSYGLSYNKKGGNVNDYNSFSMHRAVLNACISQYNEEYLFSELKQSRRAYEKRIINIIDEYFEKPSDFFDLKVLCSDYARFFSYDSIDLRESLKRNVRLDIDWRLAIRILGLHALSGQNKD